MRLGRGRWAIAALVALLVPLSADAAPPPGPVRRVFVYVMENTSYNDVIGNPQAPYLNSLAKRFALATNYTATGHMSFDNYVAMTSGQAPNPGTMTDCALYAAPLCVQDVPSIASQLDAAKRPWKGYFDAMPRPCAHPAENSPGGTQARYAPHHNPFVHYRSVVSDEKRCAAHVVGLDQLWRDQQRRAVPDYAFVVPDTCHDGHDSGPSCAEGGGVREADSFAKRTIPRILADRSFREGGLLILTFDEGGVADDDTPLSVDSGQPDFGGRVFTLLVSPRITRAAKLSEPYDHYSLLKTVEDVFCLPYLGHAADEKVRSMIGAIGQKRCAKR